MLCCFSYWKQSCFLKVMYWILLLYIAGKPICREDLELRSCSFQYFRFSKVAWEGLEMICVRSEIYRSAKKKEKIMRALSVSGWHTHHYKNFVLKISFCIPHGIGWAAKLGDFRSAIHGCFVGMPVISLYYSLFEHGIWCFCEFRHQDPSCQI